MLVDSIRILSVQTCYSYSQALNTNYLILGKQKLKRVIYIKVVVLLDLYKNCNEIWGSVVLVLNYENNSLTGNYFMADPMKSVH